MTGGYGRSGPDILHECTIAVEPGEIAVIVGPNGAGKTTLLKLLTGEIAPDAGTVRLGTALEIAVFDQNRTALDPEMSLWDSLTGSPEMRVSGRADQVMVRGQPRHVVGYLKDFLFSDAQARAPVKALSGGEQQMLTIARTLMGNPSLVLLDEPSEGVAPVIVEQMAQVITQLKSEGLTVLLSEQNLHFARAVADHAVIIESGARVYYGTLAELNANPDIRDAYLAA